jgi:hypothetical protein
MLSLVSLEQARVMERRKQSQEKSSLFGIWGCADNKRDSIVSYLKLYGFQCLLLTHWMDGDMGSDMLTFLICKICDQFPDHHKAAFSVVPSFKVLDSLDKYHLLCALTGRDYQEWGTLISFWNVKIWSWQTLTDSGPNHLILFSLAPFPWSVQC